MKNDFKPQKVEQNPKVVKTFRRNTIL